MAGPGNPTAMLLLAGRAESTLVLLFSFVVISAPVIPSCLVVFLLGIVFAALAVRFVIDGLRAAVSV